MNEIKKIFTSEKIESDYLKEVAEAKYFLELLTMEPDFKQNLEREPEKILQQYKINHKFTDLQLLYDEEKLLAYKKKNKELPLIVRRYQSFIKEKLLFREEMQKNKCAPQNKIMREWRQRQVNRCWGELGGRNQSIIHTPVIFELNLGCSVGCPFCGVNAPKLTLVCDYAANKELWQNILKTTKEIIGEAAGMGTCYYATEPLDNPDYEKFSQDFYAVFQRIPQVTTAVPLRDITRTKAVLQHMLDTKPTIFRFSVRSLAQLRELHQAFRPEELLFVELLPQFSAAPNNSFSAVGRARKADAEENTGETISCISGFIINMAEKSVRLITPCGADKEHPTGEICLGKEFFTSEQDFALIISKMIKEKMQNELDPQKKIKFYSYFQYQEEDIGFSLMSKTGFKVHFKGNNEALLYQKLGQEIVKGEKNRLELVSCLYEKGFAPANIFLALNTLFKAGVLEE